MPEIQNLEADARSAVLTVYDELKPLIEEYLKPLKALGHVFTGVLLRIPEAQDNAVHFFVDFISECENI